MYIVYLYLYVCGYELGSKLRICTGPDINDYREVIRIGYNKSTMYANNYITRMT